MKFGNFDNFLSLNLLNFFTVAFTMTTLVPITIKFQGIHFSLFVIGLFHMIKLSSGLLQPFLKPISLLNQYKLLMVSNFLTVMSVLTVYLDGFIFAISLSIFTSLEAIIITAFVISLDTYVSEKYSGTFRDFKITEAFVGSAASVSGTLFISFFSLFLEFNSLIIITLISSLFMYYTQYKFYKLIKEIG